MSFYYHWKFWLGFSLIVWYWWFDFLFFVIKVLLGKWTFCFLSSFCFCFYCKTFENQNCRILELWSFEKDIQESFIDHWLFVLTFKRKLRIAYSVCIGIGNRLLSPIIRIHWTKRLYFFISLHWLGQSHISWVSLPLPASKQQPLKIFA